MKKTPNGRVDNGHYDHVPLIYRQTTAKLNNERLNARGNAERTRKNTSAATLAKQERAHSDKKDAQQRVAELNEYFSKTLNLKLEELKDAVIFSLLKSGITATVAKFGSEFNFENNIALQNSVIAKLEGIFKTAVSGLDDENLKTEILKSLSAQGFEKTLKDYKEVLSSLNGFKSVYGKLDKASIPAVEEVFNKKLETSSLKYKLIASFKKVGIDESLKIFEPELKTFEANSEEYTEKQKESGITRVYSYYDEMLFSIAKKYPEFILHLPAPCFLISSSTLLPIQNLNAQQHSALEKRLVKENLFSNPVFKSKYTKFFPNHILELTDITDISFALSLSPESFKLLPEDGALRRSFKQNAYLLDAIIKSAPQVVKYLSEKEIYLYAKTNLAYIGNAIAIVPEILDYLPADFFEKFDPKLVFAYQKKFVLKDVLAPYFKKFPILQTYFSSVRIKTPTVDQPAETSFNV